MFDPFQITLAWVALINLAALLAMAWDKRAARGRRRRVSERRILWLAALGGTPGVFAAIHLFAHKTRKKPFRRWLFVILAAQILGLGVLLAM